jgi:acetolactate synthase-1/2/3 large subunit
MNLTNQLTGGQYIVNFLKSQGVDTVFCITGAGNLAIVDALSSSPEIRLVFSHHEQAAVMEAQGYSRISGKPGVALVTTGGGTSNIVTGVLSAQLDSVPVFVISGNESSFHCEAMSDFRAYGVQGFDSVAVMTPITKMATRVLGTESLDEILANSWLKMITDRKGAVHVDVPMDIQRKSDAFPSSVKRIKVEAANSFEPEEIKTVASALLAAQRPVFYFGNGIRSETASSLLDQLWQKLSVPSFLSWSALDLLPESHDSNFGRIGIYGDRFANVSLQRADLVICVGTRLAIPQVGYDKNDFGRNAQKWVIDCDPIELSKFSGESWNTLLGDGVTFINALLNEIDSSGSVPVISEWVKELHAIRSAIPRNEQVGPRPGDDSGFVHSVDVMTFLNTALSDTAIIGTDVGAALLSGHYALEIKGSQTLFTSQGLGEMGFGLPATLGASFAAPDRQLICLNTDGAIMFNLQELQLISQERIPVKLFIFNNDGYSMIKISQENLFDGRYVGSTPSSGVSFPSFEKLSAAFNLSYTKITSTNQFASDLKTALQSNRAELIEIVMDPNQKYLPRLGTSKREDGSLVSPPLEDLDPKIDLSLLEKLLGQKAHPNSYAARGLDYA